MNIHVPKNAESEWASIEFLGKPFMMANWKFMKVKEKGSGKSGLYCFEKNVIYFNSHSRGKDVDFKELLESF